jgi:hypothetical protein
MALEAGIALAAAPVGGMLIKVDLVELAKLAGAAFRCFGCGAALRILVDDALWVIDARWGMAMVFLCRDRFDH